MQFFLFLLFCYFIIYIYRFCSFKLLLLLFYLLPLFDAAPFLGASFAGLFLLSFYIKQFTVFLVHFCKHTQSQNSPHYTFLAAEVEDEVEPVTLKKSATLVCVACCKFLVIFAHPFRIRSSAKPFSLTINSTQASTSGPVHVSCQDSTQYISSFLSFAPLAEFIITSISDPGVTSGLRNNSRASA